MADTASLTLEVPNAKYASVQSEDHLQLGHRQTTHASRTATTPSHNGLRRMNPRNRSAADVEHWLYQLDVLASQALKCSHQISFPRHICIGARSSAI
jgi:hypothetical protein